MGLDIYFDFIVKTPLQSPFEEKKDTSRGALRLGMADTMFAEYLTEEPMLKSMRTTISKTCGWLSGWNYQDLCDKIEEEADPHTNYAVFSNPDEFAKFFKKASDDFPTKGEDSDEEDITANRTRLEEIVERCLKFLNSQTGGARASRSVKVIVSY